MQQGNTKNEKTNGIIVNFKQDTILNRLILNARDLDSLPNNICSYCYQIILSFFILILSWPSILLNLINSRISFKNGYINRKSDQLSHLSGFIFHFFSFLIGIASISELNIKFGININIHNIFYIEIIGIIFCIIYLLILLFGVYILCKINDYCMKTNFKFNLKSKFKINLKSNFIYKYFKKLKENNCLKINWKNKNE